MANIILPQVNILNEINDSATMLVEQNGEINRFNIADLDIGGGDVTINLEDSNISKPNPVNADTLGGYDASHYITVEQFENFATIEQMKKAAPRNLLDNSDFRNPVNQRGETSYSGSTHNIDRWRSFQNDNVVTVDNGCIRQTGTQLLQNLDANVIDETKTYTLAACKVDGTIRITSGTFAQKFGNSYLSCYIVTSTGVPRCVLLESDGYKWAALYEGEYTAETLPEYQPKGYGVEVVNCNGGALSMKLLWENAAPESDFVEQTIPLDLSEYNCVAIYSKGPYIMQFVFKGLASSLVGLVHEISTSNYVACRSRSVSASDTGIKFGSGIEKKLTEKVITTLDSGVKPLYIYGVKGESV